MNTTVNPPAASLAPQMATGGLLGHPRGLTTLFFTEMWERFSFYGMRALLVLYMTAAVTDGGLGFDVKTAAMIYGWYTMLVYTMSIPGGFIADRFLGARNAVFIGGIVIMAGHFALIFHGLTAFFGGLVLIVLGTGLLKPNISTMLGSLYSSEDDRRDGGFSLFYMGINIGATMAPLVCGFLAQDKGFKNWLASIGLNPLSSWHWGFAAAGIGMALGLIQYLAQRKRLQHVGNRPVRKQAVAGVAAEPVQKLTVAEWKRLGAIAVLFVFSVLFWAIYEQGGSSLNLFADKLTNNNIFGYEVPSSWYQSVPAFFVIVLAPVFTFLWGRMGDKQPSSPGKFMIGLVFLGLGIGLAVPATILAASGKVSPLFLVGIYFLQVVGELCLSPVGLSTVTKLAPVRLVGSIMGIWFLSMALGNLLAGYLGGFFDEKNLNLLLWLFAGMTGAVLVSAAVLALLVKPVKRLMGDKA